MNNPLSGNVPKWVFAIGMIVALLIPTGILLSQQSYVGESETTSMTIHNPLWVWSACQMDIEHEIAKDYRGGFWIPPGEERYLVLTYYIVTDPVLEDLEIWTEYFYWTSEWEFAKAEPTGIQVIVPYMPSGGDIGIVYVDWYCDIIARFGGAYGAILTVVALFSAPEGKPWYVSNVKIVLSNLVIDLSSPAFPIAAVSIEHYITSSPPIP